MRLRAIGRLAFNDIRDGDGNPGRTMHGRGMSLNVCAEP